MLHTQANYEIVWATPEIWIWRKGQYETQVAVAQPPNELEAVKYVKASHALQMAARIVDLEAENEKLLSLCQTWSESCTGRHGSQMQCVTAQNVAKHKCKNCGREGEPGSPDFCCADCCESYSQSQRVSESK